MVRPIHISRPLLFGRQPPCPSLPVSPCLHLGAGVQRLRFEEDFGSGWVSEMAGGKPCFELIEEDPGDHGGEFPDDHGGEFPDDHGGEFPDEGGFPDEGALPDQEGDWPPEGELPPDEDGAKARSGMS